jgi:hypothetical protein
VNLLVSYDQARTEKIKQKQEIKKKQELSECTFRPKTIEFNVNSFNNYSDKKNMGENKQSDES